MYQVLLFKFRRHLCKWSILMVPSLDVRRVREITLDVILYFLPCTSLGDRGEKSESERNRPKLYRHPSLTTERRLGTRTGQNRFSVHMFRGCRPRRCLHGKTREVGGGGGGGGHIS